MKSVPFIIEILWPMLKMFLGKSVTLIFTLTLMALTLVRQKGLTTRNTHMKYESCTTDHSKVIANIKVILQTHSLRQNRQRDRAKTKCPRFIDGGGGASKKDGT